MLMGSDINPFDSQETKPYKNDPEIVAMTDLVSAYQRREVHEAEKILRENQKTFRDDEFIKSYIDELLNTLRSQYLLDVIKPYSQLGLDFLAKVRCDAPVSDCTDCLCPSLVFSNSTLLPQRSNPFFEPSSWRARLLAPSTRLRKS